MKKLSIDFWEAVWFGIALAIIIAQKTEKLKLIDISVNINFNSFFFF